MPEQVAAMLQAAGARNFFATAAFVMGEPGVTWVSGIDGYGALAITEDRRTVWTSGVDRLLTPTTAPAT